MERESDRVQRVIRFLLTALAPISLFGCGEAGSSSKGKLVSEADFASRGLLWPLTVQSGTVGCDADARWFESGGIRYGLNGTATVERGFKEIEPIWADDAKMNSELAAAGVKSEPLMRVNIGDMIEEAGKQCS